MKQKIYSKIMERRSIDLFVKILPEFWETRIYHPDYGVDLSIEIFDTKCGKFITAGEHLFVQIKSVEAANIQKFNLIDRKNVEMAPLDSLTRCDIEVDVIKFDIDIAELNLALSMSASIPLILILVDLSTENIYFLSLTDYVEKICFRTITDNPEQKFLRLYIPKSNTLNAERTAILRDFSSRPKLYSFFNKARYLYKEIYYARTDIDKFSYSKIFIHRLRYIFDNNPLINRLTDDIFFKIDHIHDQIEIELKKASYSIVKKLILQLENYWRFLADLGRIFEDVGRETYMPTKMSQVGHGCISLK